MTFPSMDGVNDLYVILLQCVTPFVILCTQTAKNVSGFFRREFFCPLLELFLDLLPPLDYDNASYGY